MPVDVVSESGGDGVGEGEGGDIAEACAGVAQCVDEAAEGG
jgi:hypothetical protein